MKSGKKDEYLVLGVKNELKDLKDREVTVVAGEGRKLEGQGAAKFSCFDLIFNRHDPKKGAPVRTSVCVMGAHIVFTGNEPRRVAHSPSITEMLKLGKAVRKEVKKLKKDGTHVLLMGDFNESATRSFSLRLFKKRYKQNFSEFCRTLGDGRIPIRELMEKLFGLECLLSAENKGTTINLKTRKRTLNQYDLIFVSAVEFERSVRVEVLVPLSVHASRKIVKLPRGFKLSDSWLKAAGVRKQTIRSHVLRCWLKYFGSETYADIGLLEHEYGIGDRTVQKIFDKLRKLREAWCFERALEAPDPRKTKFQAR
ncbi:MAG: hypothetical protein MHM6MM_006296 [Cercozoa sp. M6MM]